MDFSFDDSGPFPSPDPPETITTNAFDLFKQRIRRQPWEEQLGPAPGPTDTERVDVETLPTVQHGGKRYVREDQLYKKGAKGKKSFHYRDQLEV